ncbi:copper amine oxidase N-terminal domain-containing protein [bacterium]|nr:copper amine oxidase N-terminal domain-containing protein [bacterium]
MQRASHLVAFGVLLALILATAGVADELVKVYVGNRYVPMKPDARVRNGVTYAPLRAAAEAVGATVKWDAADRMATICTADRCAPIRQNQGIMVGGSMMIPVRLMSEALGRAVTWDPAARAVRIRG